MRPGGGRRWVPAGLWAALILVGTSIPGPALPPGPSGSDKLAHALLYGVLGVLVARAVLAGAGGWEHSRRRLAFIVLEALVLCGAFGAADEWHQQFVRRSTSLADWVADLAGIAIGACVVAHLGRRAGRRKRSRGGHEHGAGTADRGSGGTGG